MMDIVEIKTTSINYGRMIRRADFERYLISKGFTPEIGGAYRSPCCHFKTWLCDLQKSIDDLAVFEGRGDTESLYQDMMNLLVCESDV